MSRFIGVARDPQFSPGKVDLDRQILESTAACLRDGGHTVDVIAETDDQWPQPSRQTVVFTMSQGRPALQRLREWELDGVRVVNRPEGILNCQRHRTVLLLTGSDVGFPRTVVLDELASARLGDWIDTSGAWIKRGDVHAIEADDVVHVRSHEAAHVALVLLSKRGIERAVVQEHVPGRVVKFYGVVDRFFHAVQPPDTSKLDEATLHAINSAGQRAAAALGVEVYGGDCVVGAHGEVSLIDLNDWPSYSACLSDAAASISAYLEKVAES